MRKDDPSSRRTRRRKGRAAVLAEVIVLGARQQAAAPSPRSDEQLDCDFGVALCLGPALRGRRLPEA